MTGGESVKDCTQSNAWATNGSNVQKPVPQHTQRTINSQLYYNHQMQSRGAISPHTIRSLCAPATTYNTV